ncbi:MAG: CHAT domain-containing protein [Chitinophagaceae bacterium]|nr:CHAT domain-containing protein [Chitinophagaceae bacterium]MCW5926427.1 CHAT domain-containing protein [Chitinophagaceae bacterium]
MRWLIVIYALVMGGNLAAQESGYSKAVNALRNQEYDSAILHINEAIRFFSGEQTNDSLVFSYVQKAEIVWEQKGIQPALTILDETLKIAGNLPANSIARVAALNKKAQVHVHNAEAETGKKYFLQALSHIPANAAPNIIYGNLYTNVSWLYLELQDFTPALRYAGEARKIYEGLYGKDARQLMGVYQSLMLIAHDAGWYSQSEEYGLELHRLANLHLRPDHPNKGLVHNDLGTLYESMHRLDEALFHRQRMVHIIQQDYAKHKNPQLLAIAYNNMGNLYRTMGEIQLAEAYFEKAKELHEINFGPSGAGFVRPLVHLANAKKDLGNYPGAEELYARAYALQKKVAGNDWRNMAYVEAQYGDLFFAKEQYPEAETYYKQALANHAKAGIGNTTIVEETRTTLAETYARSGRTGEAALLLQEVLNRQKKLYPKGNIVIAGMYNKHAVTWLLGQQPEKALRYSDSVFLELLQVPVLPDNWMEKLPYNHHIIRYLKDRALIEAALYQKNGKTASLENIIALAEQYGSYLERSLPALRTQATLMQLARQHREIYNAAIDACWQLYQKDNKTVHTEKAFEFAERSRALVLRLAANNIMIDASRTGGDATDEQDLYWRKRISSLNAQYLDSEKRNDSLLTLLTGSMESYRLFQDSVLRSGNLPAKQKYRLDPAGIDEIQAKLLGNKQTLLQYIVTSGHIYAFVLNGKQFSMHRLPAGGLQEAAELKQLYNITPGKFSTAAYRLYEGLIQPLEQQFASGKLIIIPDGELFYLNFELLVSGNSNRDFNAMQYLIHRYEISYQLSATGLVLNTWNRVKDKRAMLLTPVFTDDMKQAYLRFIGDSSLADQQYFSLLRQPFSVRAAKQIGGYIKNDLYAEQAADESIFKQTAENYHILHLGTHAEVNNAAPLQSRFFLAKELTPDSVAHEDGYLHAYEIYAMQLQAELAVLTACETGIGNWSQGEGVMSLAHSFMYAGCPSVVMSLWKIDEKASADIIAAFYRHLSGGKSKSESLRLAKIEHMEESGAHTHPYFWAGMTLVGNEEPVYASSMITWIIPAGLVLLTGLWWFRNKRKGVSPKN